MSIFKRPSEEQDSAGLGIFARPVETDEESPGPDDAAQEPAAPGEPTPPAAATPEPAPAPSSLDPAAVQEIITLRAALSELVVRQAELVSHQESALAQIQQLAADLRAEIDRLRAGDGGTPWSRWSD